MPYLAAAKLQRLVMGVEGDPQLHPLTGAIVVCHTQVSYRVVGLQIFLSVYLDNSPTLKNSMYYILQSELHLQILKNDFHSLSSMAFGDIDFKSGSIKRFRAILFSRQ